MVSLPNYKSPFPLVHLKPNNANGEAPYSPTVFYNSLFLFEYLFVCLFVFSMGVHSFL